MRTNRHKDETNSVAGDKKADNLFVVKNIVVPTVQDIVKNTATNLGFIVIEQKEVIKPDDILVKAVVWQKRGVVIDDLVLITKEVMRKVEMNPKIVAEGYADMVRLELSSPGIDRKFKSLVELSYFKGSVVNIVLMKPESGVFELTGEILKYEDNVLTLGHKDGIVEINSSNISAARLAG